MANRIITATVAGENIKLSNKLAGAAGSFNAVSIALTFDSAWDGTTKKVYFFDVNGENAVYRLLTTDLLVDGAYIVPIPAEPLAHAGEMTITIRGVELDGETAERIIMSASTTMKVLSAIAPDSDVLPVEPTPTQAEQLLSAVNKVVGMTATAVSVAPEVPASVNKTNNPDGTINLAFGIPKGTKGDKGDTGNTGATGNGISSAVLNADYTLSITFTDGSTYTTSPIRGAQGEQGVQGIQGIQGAQGLKGDKGDTGLKGDTGAKGDTGLTGATGNGIASVVLLSGTHAAGTTDIYRISFTDGTHTDFGVYNGADGQGSGDMLKAVYDPNAKNADAFDVDNHVSGTTNKVYTATEQSKLAGIAEGAEVNVNADWNASSGDAQILNKPTTMTPASHTHGNITNDGKIGSTADLPVFTTTDGSITTKTIADAKTLLGIVSGVAQIATGSYVGTDTYGSANPNSLTFDFVPKLLSICRYQDSRNRIFYDWVSVFPNISLGWVTTTYKEFHKYLGSGFSEYGLMIKKSVDGKTIYWYSNDSSTNQLSNIDGLYYYYAIG